MPTSFRLTPNAAKRLEQMPGTRREVKAKTQQIVNHAKDLAPDHGPGITGRYNDSLKVVEAGDEFHALADVPYAAWVEAKYNTLGRAMHP